MFEQVSTQLDELLGQLEVPASREALTWVLGFADRVQARALEAVRTFDDGEGWRDEGATSMTAWLRHQGRMSSPQARRTTRTAQRLGDLPVTAAAYRDGSLSGGQVQAIMANLNDALTPEFAAAETVMVPLLVPLSVRDVARVMQAWAQAAKDELQDDEPDEVFVRAPRRRSGSGEAWTARSSDPSGNRTRCAGCSPVRTCRSVLPDT
jgi:hypothetical protein